MSKLRTLSKKRATLRTARENTSVVVPNGKFSWESNLIMRVCELEKITDSMADKLSEIAQSYGFGEEYEKICGMLEKLNEYQGKALNSLATGRDWGDFPEIKIRQNKKENIIGDGVFCKTWDEIEKMQGGKLNRK